MKRKRAERRPDENYPTPPDFALAITQRVAEVVGPVRFIVEPSAGDGAFVRAARIVFPSAVIAAIDIRPEARKPCLDAGADGFRQEDWVEHLRIEGGLNAGTLVLGNPPYRSGPGVEGDLATKHIVAALDHLAPGSYLAFLLPLYYLGCQDRVRRLWERRDLLAWFQMAERVSFDGEGTANTEYCVCIWQAGFHGNAQTLPPLWVRHRQPDVPLSVSVAP